MEKRSGRGFHSFLDHLDSMVDPVPGFKRVALVQVYHDRMVHLLYSMFSVPVGLYSTDRRLFACCGELPR